MGFSRMLAVEINGLILDIRGDKHFTLSGESIKEEISSSLALVSICVIR